MIAVFALCGVIALFSGLYVLEVHLRNKRSTAVIDFRQNLGKAVADGVFTAVTKDPDRPLTEEGFRWACYIALLKYWPGVTPEDAGDWLIEYASEPFGSDGYDWTFAGAQNLAREYVLDFGESESNE